MPTTIKVSEELLSKFGATAADFEEKVMAALKSQEEAKASEDKWDVAIKKLNGTIEAMEGRVKAVEGRTITVSAEELAKITTAAQTEASKVASQILSKAGSQAMNGGGKEDDGNKDKADPNDPKAMWDANANLREEFVEFKNWETFHKANAEGRVRFATKASAKE
jgi:hypothetical protein